MFDVGGKTWKSYNWSIVTTVATFGKYDAELMCHAHSVGARVVLKGKFICVLNHNCFIFLTKDHVPNLVIYFFVKGDVRLTDIVDPKNRTAWIKEKVNLAKSQFMDGINLDIEQAVEAGSPEGRALTDLVKESSEAFHREIPGSQVRNVCSCHFMLILCHKSIINVLICSLFVGVF